MKQIKILRSGCQVGYKEILYVSNRYIIYASTLAIYVLNAKTFVLEKVLGVTDKQICSIAVSPIDPNLIAISGINGLVSIWKIDEEIKEKQLNTMIIGAKIIFLWDPHTPDHGAILIAGKGFRLLYWNTSISTAQEIFKIGNDKVLASVGKYNPHLSGIIAVGFDNSVVCLFNTKDKTQQSLQIKDRKSPVVDLQWDRLSSIYLLVAYDTFISLWDTETKTEIHIFETQSTRITSIAWMDWTAGNFISTNSVTGIVKVWNVSQKAPIKSIRVSQIGILNGIFGSNDHRLFVSCNDGSTVLYHIEKNVVEYETQAGHTETIFDATLSPLSADIVATCSYDSTIKVWNLQNSNLNKTLIGNGLIYSLDWSPDAKYIIGATSNGACILWDAETGRELGQYTHHTKPIYGITWNQSKENIILSTSYDCLAVVFQIETENLNDLKSNGFIGSRKKDQMDSLKSVIRFKTAHPMPIFGCSWCHSNSNYFSTGCQDGIVRIFDYVSQVQIYRLCGHQGRSFNTVWSTLISGLLASGSDDKTINIWQIDFDNLKVDDSHKVTDLKPIRSLTGHTSNVRALCWNLEHKNILLSGSWDATIRIWDALKGILITVIRDHVADVYSICSHVTRPFTFISCSRDTTLRVWEFDGLFSLLKMKVVWNLNFKDLLETEFTDKKHYDYATGPTRSRFFCDKLPPYLCGQESSSINVGLMKRNEPLTSIKTRKRVSSDPIKRAEDYYDIFNYFSGSSGCIKIFEAVKSLLYSQSSNGKTGSIRDNDKLFFPENEILSRAKSDAKKLESNRMNKRKGDMSKKVEELLREAAMMYARLGDMNQCCSILIDIGDWTTALALAPSVSLEYWQELTAKYADHLATNFSENCIPHLLAIKKYEEAVDFYLKRRDYYDALVVAKASESSSSSFQQSASSFSTNDADSNPKSRVLIENVISESAKQYLEENLPITASAQYLRIGDAQSAIQLLSMCGDHELAFAVSDCLGYDTRDIIISMADKCASLGDVDLALTMLSDIDKGDEELGLLLSRYCDDDSFDKYAKSYFKDGLHYWVNRAVEEETIGNDGDAVVALVISRQYTKAVTYGSRYLKKYLKDPLEMNATGRRVLKGLKYVRVVDIEEPLRLPFLCHLLWFCAHEAAEIKQWDTAVQMLRVLDTHCTKFPFSLTSDDITYQLLFFRILGGDYSVEETLRELQLSNSSRTELAASFRTLRSLIRDETAGGKGDAIYGANTPIVYKEIQRLGESLSLPSLSKLFKGKSINSLPQLLLNKSTTVPLSSSGTNNNRSNGFFSIVSGRKITGKVIHLGTVSDDDETDMYHISSYEAQNWRRIYPFSPNMSGELISF